MSDDRKTVTNITHGGSISVGSINLGEIENSSLEILSRIDVTSPTDAELRLTLERFVGAIATDVEVSQEDKAVLHAVVQDVATYQHEPPEKRRTLLQKSVAALKGLTVTLPAAAKFATEARALIDAIARVLTP